MEAGSLDSSLYCWEDIAAECDWRTLLIGNGLSINVWPDFAYSTLLDYAGSLGARDSALFEYEGTPNFELVLADLNTAMGVATICGLRKDEIDLLERHYQRIQKALTHAIGAVHPANPGKIPHATLVAIRAHLRNYGWVFTTSYDLLLYWAMGAGPDGFRPFTDLFLYRHGGRHEFDTERARKRIPTGRTAVCYLHGALHLVVGSGGVTWKLVWGVDTLLDQFGRPISGDPQARPLLVTEGSYIDKLRVIDANAYLNHALRRLRERKSALVVFGSRLGPEDQHVVDAINANPRRPVAVSVYARTRRDVIRIKSDIRPRLEAEQVLFFDSKTHPLGHAELRPEAMASHPGRP